MGYTIYWKTREPLTEDEILAGIRALKENFDPAVLRVDFYEENLKAPKFGVILNPVHLKHPVESLVFGRFPSAWEKEKVSGIQLDGTIEFSFCKTNRCQPEDREIKELLRVLNKAVHRKLEITCDDGRQY